MPDISTGQLATEGGLKPIAVSGLKIPEDGIIVVQPFADKLLDGSKTVLVKSRPFKISGKDYLLLTRNKALGIIKLSAPRQINLKEFRELKERHKIDEKTRKKFWPDKKKFWAYRVLKIRVFAAPIPIDAVKGPQVVVRGVKLQAKDARSVFELAKAEGDALMRFGAWLRVVAAEADEWSKSVLRFVKGPKKAVRVIREFPAFVRSIARSFPAGEKVDAEVGFPKAVEQAISWGEKASKALAGIGRKDLSGALQKALDRLREVEKLLDSIQEAENNPILKV